MNANIILPQKGSANARKARENDSAAKELFGFLKLTPDHPGKAREGNGIAAKLARVVKENPTKGEQLQKILASAPDHKTAMKEIKALLEEAPQKPAGLTSDLAASHALSLQGEADEASVLAQLQEMFAGLDGLLPEDLGQFREDAIAMLRGLGLDDAQVEGYLVKLGMALERQITQAQATQLMMPLPHEAPKPVLVTPEPVLPDAKAQAQVTPKPVLAAAEPALPDAKAQAQVAPDAPDEAPLPREAAPKGQQASHVSLVNSLASEGGADGFNQSFGQGFGQNFGQNAGQPLAPGLQMTGSATTESFVNHMTAAQGGTMTQSVALQIQRNAQAQISTFQMQLHPSELGRLEVRLRFMRDGTMKAHITADKADTLSLLQKDAQQLHRVLEQAGIDLDENALSFDLRQQGRDGAQQSYNDKGAPRADDDSDAPLSAGAIQATLAVETAGYVRPGGVNIMV